MVQTSLGAHGASVHRMLDEIACVVESRAISALSAVMIPCVFRKYSKPAKSIKLLRPFLSIAGILGGQLDRCSDDVCVEAVRNAEAFEDDLITVSAEAIKFRQVGIRCRPALAVGLTPLGVGRHKVRRIVPIRA
jgi:hypothetical protein